MSFLQDHEIHKERAESLSRSSALSSVVDPHKQNGFGRREGAGNLGFLMLRVIRGAQAPDLSVFDVRGLTEPALRSRASSPPRTGAAGAPWQFKL